MDDQFLSGFSLAHEQFLHEVLTDLEEDPRITIRSRDPIAINPKTGVAVFIGSWEGNPSAFKVIPCPFDVLLAVARREVGIMDVRLKGFPRVVQTFHSYEHRPHRVTRSTSPDAVVIVMELVEDQTITQLIRQGPIAQKQAVRMALRVVEALQVIFEEYGVIHRDVKPGNVFWDQTREDVRLTDFGISKLLVPRQSTLIEGGSPVYYAPDEKGGTRGDLYAVGVLLAAMVTGQNPPSVDGKGRVLRPSVAAPSRHILPCIDEFVLLATGKRGKRFKNHSQMIKALQRLANQVQLDETSSNPFSKGKIDEEVPQIMIDDGAYPDLEIPVSSSNPILTATIPAAWKLLFGGVIGPVGVDSEDVSHRASVLVRGFYGLDISCVIASIGVWFLTTRDAPFVVRFPLMTLSIGGGIVFFLLWVVKTFTTLEQGMVFIRQKRGVKIPLFLPIFTFTVALGCLVWSCLLIANPTEVLFLSPNWLDTVVFLVGSLFLGATARWFHG